jgi:small subunit ribosomal protein S18
MKTFKPMTSYIKPPQKTGANNMANKQKTNKFAAQKGSKWFTAVSANKPRVLSISQLLARLRLQRQKRQEQQKRGVSISIDGLTRSMKPIIPPKSLVITLKEKPEKALYNRRIIDYKHCGLLQRYIGIGGKILPRRQTRLTAKQQRYVAKTIKTARVMALLPFVSKEKSFYR